MRDKLVNKIKKIVKKACFSKENFYGASAWDHIVLVVKNAKLLAIKLKADREIVEIAAWFHDYASVINKKYYPQHHIYSARLAERFLQKYKFPKSKIRQIKHCILSNRGSRNIKRKTLEAKLLANADAMAYFDNVKNLLALATDVYKMDKAKASKWVLKKLKQSWFKLIPQSKELLKDKYKSIRIGLN